jgi:hypothetical protein
VASIQLTNTLKWVLLYRIFNLGFLLYAEANHMRGEGVKALSLLVAKTL